MLTKEMFTTPEQEAEKQRTYDDELIRRYLAGLPLTNTDKRDARRLIKQRKSITP